MKKKKTRKVTVRTFMKQKKTKKKKKKKTETIHRRLSCMRFSPLANGFVRVSSL